MNDFIGDDLSGARFERVNLTGAQMRRINMTGVEMRGALVKDARLIGLELWNVEITGELLNVTVNGVDIGPLVEAELNRRMPDRAKMRPTDAAGFCEAWDILERRWDGIVAHARTLPTGAVHRRVGGEWSFIETLRHLGFATAAWVGRMILGNPSPWHPLDLPWDEAPGWDGIPWDREVQPDLDGVLALRRERQAMVRDVVESLTDEQLASTVTCLEPGWPQLADFPLRECLLIILNEEWEHAGFAARDLAAH
jgi:hypothetical protein